MAEIQTESTIWRCSKIGGEGVVAICCLAVRFTKCWRSPYFIPFYCQPYIPTIYNYLCQSIIK